MQQSPEIGFWDEPYPYGLMIVRYQVTIDKQDIFELCEYGPRTVPQRTSWNVMHTSPEMCL